MLIKEIDFPSTFECIEDIYDSNIDVFVTLAEDCHYNVIVGTPQNLLTLMN
jgi:hypothetical protein